MTREELLRELLSPGRPTASIVAELSQLPWDSPPLLRVERTHLLEMLERLESGEFDARELQLWADAVEGRDDLEYDAEFVAALSEGSNPDLFGALDDVAVQVWRRRLQS